MYMDVQPTPVRALKRTFRYLEAAHKIIYLESKK